MKINTSQSVEQHSTWIASNPVVGCPKGCEYCFLRPSNLTQVKPSELWSPIEAITELLGSDLYNPEIPVAIGTRTDMFATPDNRKYLLDYLAEWDSRGINNTLVMITKCEIPPEIIQKLVDYKSVGRSFIVFLSYSGLDSSVEKGINHEKLRVNFETLHAAGVPIVHYWRPFTPDNSTPEVMVPVLETASPHASSSMVAGLKMTRAMIDQFGFWPELQKLDLDLANYESIYTASALQQIALLMENNPDYPIYFATSCTIANALKVPEFNGVWGTEVCRKSSCGSEQRNVCEAFHRGRTVTQPEVDRELERLNLHVKYEIRLDDIGVASVHFLEEMKDNILYNVSQSLKVIVTADKVSDSDYGWGSQIYQKTLIVES